MTGFDMIREANRKSEEAKRWREANKHLWHSGCGGHQLEYKEPELVKFNSSQLHLWEHMR